MLVVAKKIFTSFIKNVMKVEYQCSPAFRAKFVNSINIGKLNNSFAKYADSKVSFVEIEPHNDMDIDALEKCSKYWSYAKFTDNIYQVAYSIRNNSKYHNKNKVYALTSQTDKFEKLHQDKILGLIHVSPLEDKTIFIDHLQVKPDIIYTNKPEYKGVGTGILTSLKLLADKIKLFPTKEKSVRDFYERNGFFEFTVGSNIFTWVKALYPQK